MAQHAAAELPLFAFGQNASLARLQALCPNRDYQHCLIGALQAKYPQHNLYISKTDNAAIWKQQPKVPLAPPPRLPPARARA